MNRFILVRESRKDPARFPLVTVRDTTLLVDTVINGRDTREYMAVSETMPYLDAFPIAAKLNRAAELWEETKRAATAKRTEEGTK